MIALFEVYRAGLFRREHVLSNIVSGTIVGIVALPLAMAFAIAMLGAIESLLSAVVADGMAGTRHNSNQELNGAANACFRPRQLFLTTASDEPHATAEHIGRYTSERLLADIRQIATSARGTTGHAM